MTFAVMATPGQSKSPWYASSPPEATAIWTSLWNAVEGWPSAQIEWRARGTEFRAGPPEHGGILAREYPSRAKPDRVSVELVQRHLERSAVAGRAGQPFG